MTRQVGNGNRITDNLDIILASAFQGEIYRTISVNGIGDLNLFQQFIAGVLNFNGIGQHVADFDFHAFGVRNVINGNERLGNVEAGSRGIRGFLPLGIKLHAVAKLIYDLISRIRGSSSIRLGIPALEGMALIAEVRGVISKDRVRIAGMDCGIIFGRIIRVFGTIIGVIHHIDVHTLEVAIHMVTSRILIANARPVLAQVTVVDLVPDNLILRFARLSTKIVVIDLAQCLTFWRNQIVVIITGTNDYAFSPIASSIYIVNGLCRLWCNVADITGAGIHRLVIYLLALCVGVVLIGTSAAGRIELVNQFRFQHKIPGSVAHIVFGGRIRRILLLSTRHRRGVGQGLAQVLVLHGVGGGKGDNIA